MKSAMERHYRGEGGLFQYFAPATGESMPFSNLNVLPQKDQPVSSYSERDQAWLQAVKQD